MRPRALVLVVAGTLPVGCGGGGGAGGAGGGNLPPPPTPVTFTAGPFASLPVSTLYTPPYVVNETEPCDLDDDGKDDLAWAAATTFNGAPTTDVGSVPGVGDGSFAVWAYYGGGGYTPTGPLLLTSGRVLGGVGKEGSVMALESPAGWLFVLTYGVRFTATGRIQVGGAGLAQGTLGGLAVGDWDGDGTEDVAVGDVAGTQVIAWLSAGDAGLGLPLPAALPAGTIPNDMASGDLDGDLDDDLVVALNSGGYVVMTSQGAGAFAAGTVVPLGGTRTFQSVVGGDFDGDGQADVAGVVLETGQPKRLGALLGNGNGTFGGLVLTTLPASVAAAVLLHLHAGDLNGDGDDDLAFVVPGLDRTVVMLSDGAGHFVDAPDEDLVGKGNLCLGMSDLDNDGDLDLVVGSGAGTTVRTLLNDRLP